MLPLFADLFTTIENGWAVPNDYTSLCGNQKFINVVTLTRDWRKSSISHERNLKNYLMGLVEKLELDFSYPNVQDK